MSVSVIIKFNVKSSMITEFVAILNTVKADLPNTQGCQCVDIFRCSSNANIFTLVEKWETAQLHQAHITKLTEDGSWNFISQHLSKKPESDYYNAM